MSEMMEKDAAADGAPAKRQKLETPSGGSGFKKPVTPRYGGGGGGGGSYGGNGSSAGKSIQSRNENFVRLNMKLKKYRKKGLLTNFVCQSSARIKQEFLTPHVVIFLLSLHSFKIRAKNWRRKV